MPSCHRFSRDRKLIVLCCSMLCYTYLYYTVCVVEPKHLFRDVLLNGLHEAIGIIRMYPRINRYYCLDSGPCAAFQFFTVVARRCHRHLRMPFGVLGRLGGYRTAVTSNRSGVGTILAQNTVRNLV